MTVNNFLADGGDNFFTFATITAPRLDGGKDLQAFHQLPGRVQPGPSTPHRPGERAALI